MAKKFITILLALSLPIQCFAGWMSTEPEETSVFFDKSKFDHEQKVLLDEMNTYLKAAFNPETLGLYNPPKGLKDSIELLWKITEGGFDLDRVRFNPNEFNQEPESSPFFLFFANHTTPIVSNSETRFSPPATFHISELIQNGIIGPIIPTDVDIRTPLFQSVLNRYDESTALNGIVSSRASLELKKSDWFLVKKSFEKVGYLESIQVQKKFDQFLEQAQIGTPSFRIPLFGQEQTIQDIQEIKKDLMPDAPWRLHISKDAIEGEIVTPLTASVHGDPSVPGSKLETSQRHRTGLPVSSEETETLSNDHIRLLGMNVAIWNRHLSKWFQLWFQKMRSPFRDIGRSNALAQMEKEMNLRNALQALETDNWLRKGAFEAAELESHLRSIQGKPIFFPLVKGLFPKIETLRKVFRAKLNSDPNEILRFNPFPPIVTVLAVASVAIVVGLDILDVKAAQKTAISFDDLSLRISRTIVDAGIGVGTFVLGLNAVRAMSAFAARASVALFAASMGLEVLQRTINPNIPTLTTVTDGATQYLSDAITSGHQELVGTMRKVARSRFPFISEYKPILEAWNNLRNQDEFRTITLFSPGTDLLTLATTNDLDFSNERELARISVVGFTEEIKRRAKFGRLGLEDLFKNYAQAYLKLTLTTLQFLHHATTTYGNENSQKIEVIQKLTTEIQDFLLAFSHQKEKFRPATHFYLGLGSEEIKDDVALLLYTVKYCAELDDNGELQKTQPCENTPQKRRVVNGLYELYAHL